MTGSAMDGEALNAARLANQLVRGSRLTWAEVLQPDRAVIDAANALLAENRSLVDENERLRKSSGPALPAVWATPYDDNEKIDTALAWTGVLNDWEREFTVSLADRVHLTVKQRARLDQLIGKIARIARARGL